MISNEEYFFNDSEYDLNTENIFGCVNSIFPKIEDALSKEIFINRLMYSLTQSNEFLFPIVQSNCYGKEVFDFVSKIESPIYIYGAGRRGRRVPHLYPSKYYRGYIDKNRDGLLNDLEIFSLNQISQMSDYKEAYYFITNESGVEEITQDLQNMDIPCEHIFPLNRWYWKASEDIYFDERCLDGVDREKINTFVDIGAFHGETSKKFIEWRGTEEARTVIFEPMHENYLVCMDELCEYDNKHVINAAASDTETDVIISVDAFRSSIIKEDTGCPCETVKSVVADDCLKDENVDYIKMDVEGHEERTLWGLKSTIRRCHPMLAVSVYHKREDIWRIPKTVLDISPDYSFRFGHHTLGIADTVLYAIPKNR